MFFSIKKDSQTLRFSDVQMNVEVLGKIFNLFPQTIYLTADDGTVAVPDSSGEFDLYVMTGTTTWEVHGDNSKPQPSTSSNTYGQTAAVGCSTKNKWKPFSLKKNTPPGVARQEKWSEAPKAKKAKSEQWMKNVEVCTIEDREFKKTLNLPITLNENAANVADVSDIVSEEAFNGESVVLLDVDNLRIPDITGTKGSKFWKGTRKIRAVNEEDYNSFMRTAHRPSPKTIFTLPDSDFDDSDDDFVFNIRSKDKGKGKASGETSETLTKRVNVIENAVGEIISDNAQKIAELASDKSQLQNELSLLKKSLKKVRDGFVCLICKDLPSLPMVITPCCKIIVCKACIVRWFVEADDCPQCRAMIVDKENLTTINEFRPMENISAIDPDTINE